MGEYMKKLLYMLVCVLPLVACNHEDNNEIQKCGGYDVEMTFSEEGDTMTANINVDELELSHVVSASGAKYAGILNDTIVVLWNQGEKWTLILDDDTIIDCSGK